MSAVFDPRQFTDEEIVKKIQEINSHYGQHAQMGHKSLLDSMEIYLAMLEEENEFRMMKRMDAEKKEQELLRAKSKGKKAVAELNKPISDAIIIGRIEGVDD